eukprot:NODE_2082_length_1697_cov_19.601652_g1782_i0.p1 GENE.NODE_2082_length_1697_cov_19.601652_g1782_i0~~NODE_2082_length_1697_cov_19.601652_g1782_i0.p1  ORF type:complete len:505 (+),score=77.66 NODE_2082_length_1697_cov_19.601652_g1782_i0:115-1629(+)
MGVIDNTHYDKLEDSFTADDYGSISPIPPKQLCLEDCILMAGVGWFQVRLFIVVGLFQMAEAMELTLVSFIGTIVEKELNANETQASLAASILFAGMLVGTAIWGVVSDLFGRRKALIIALTISTIAAFISAASTTYTMMVICRLFVGIGASGGHVACTLLVELVSPVQRSAWFTFGMAFFTIGVLLQCLLAYLVLEYATMSWRWLFLLSAIPSLFPMACCIPWTSESPRYLLQRGRTDDALKVLYKISNINGTSLEADKVFLSPQIEQEPSISTLLCSLISPLHLRLSVLLWLMWFGSTGSYYGVLVLTEYVFQDSGDLYLNTLITAAFEIPSYPMMLFLSEWGRRQCLALTLALAAIPLVALPSVLHSRVWSILCAGFSRMFTYTAFDSLWLYTPEIYPTYVRSTGFSICSAVGRLAGIAAPFIAQLPPIMAGSVFAVWCGIGMIAALSLRIETKGRPLDLGEPEPVVTIRTSIRDLAQSLLRKSYPKDDSPVVMSFRPQST